MCRAGKASRAAARARAEAEAQEAEAAQAAQLAQLSSAESDSPAPAATEAAAASAVPSGAHLQPSMLLAADNELSQGTSVPYLAGNADSGLDSSLLEHHTARYADQAAGAAMAGPLAGDQGMLSLQPQHNALLWGTAMPQPDAAQVDIT